MDKPILRLLSICGAILQYLFLFCSFFVGLAIVLVIFFKNFISDLNIGLNLSSNKSFAFVIFLLFIALIVLLCNCFSAKYFKNIMKNLSLGIYFNNTNSLESIRIAILNIFVIFAQISASIVQERIGIKNTSSLFNFSHSSLTPNIIIIVCAFSAFLIFKNGKVTQDDSESII